MRAYRSAFIPWKGFSRAEVMEHNKHPSKNIEILQQANNELAKEEKEEEPEIQRNKIPEPNLECPEAFISVGNEPPFDYSDDDKPFKVRLFPCKRHYSDNSSTDVSDSDSSNEFAKEEEEPEIQTDKIPD